MTLTDLQLQAWHIAEYKGQHDNLDKAEMLGVREQALAALSKIYGQVTDVAQHIKRHGVNVPTVELLLRHVIDSVLLFQQWLPTVHPVPQDRLLATLVRLTLVHTEVSEAVGALCSGNGSAFVCELADILIRVGDLAQSTSVDLAPATAATMQANAQRPHKYGTPEEGQA